MKLYLVAASVAVGLLLQTQLMAQSPALSVELVTPTHDKWAHLLDLSTSLDTVDLTIPVVKSMLQAEVGPPRYDFRNARKVERHYNRVRRYYRRQGRRDNRALQKQSHHQYLLQSRAIRQQERKRQKELDKQPLVSENERKRRK